MEHVAFENPNGQKTIVLTNSKEARNVTLRLAEKTINVRLTRLFCAHIDLVLIVLSSGAVFGSAT